MADRQRLVEQPADVAVGQVESLAHLHLHERPEDDAEDQRQHRDAEPPDREADPAEDQQQGEVERVLVDAVGTQRGEEDDAGVELRPRDLQQPRPQRRQRQVDHEQQGVADEQARQERPDELGLVGHQGRAGLDAVGAHRRDDHRGRSRHGQAEGQQRHEHAGGAGVVGGLGTGDALDGALAELLPVLAWLVRAGARGRTTGTSASPHRRPGSRRRGSRSRCRAATVPTNDASHCGP